MSNKSNSSHNVQGSWQGRYFYAHDPATPFAFEAVFIEILGIVEGNILDDNILGEARVGGTFSYPELRFTKVYMSAGKKPVKYHGTMSEDGKILTGRWVISGEINGTWVARRFGDGEMLKFEEIEGQMQTDKEEAKPLLMPVRRGTNR